MSKKSLKEIDENKSLSANKEWLTIFELTSGMRNFFTSDCRGLGEFHFFVDREEYVDVSVEELAHFFKLLFEYIDLKSFITANAEAIENELVVNIISTNEFSLSSEETLSIMKAAKNSGFQINITKEKIVLTADIIPAKVHTYSVYALGTRGIEETFRRIFNS